MYLTKWSVTFSCFNRIIRYCRMIDYGINKQKIYHFGRKHTSSSLKRNWSRFSCPTLFEKNETLFLSICCTLSCAYCLWFYARQYMIRCLSFYTSRHVWGISKKGSVFIFVFLQTLLLMGSPTELSCQLEAPPACLSSHPRPTVDCSLNQP